MIKIIKPGKPLDYYMTTCCECNTTYLFQYEDMDMSYFPYYEPELKYVNLVCPQCKNSIWGLDATVYRCDENGDSKQLVPKPHGFDDE